MLIDILKSGPLYELWKILNKPRYERQIIEDWAKNGKPIPPPHEVKFYAIKEFQKRSGHKILIETGTFKGRMIDSCKSIFNKVISIELSKELFQNACEKYKNDAQVKLFQGDSAIELPKVLKEINQACVFWLDGHFSAGITALGDKHTPINEEINSIFNHPIKNHIILIDDARLFNGENDYPKMEDFRKSINTLFPAYQFEVIDDIIRIYK